MSDRFVRVNDSGVNLFDRNGNFRANFSEGFAQIASPATDLGPEDPGRIFSGNYEMNPVGKDYPSNIVTPLPTWQPVSPQTNIAITALMGIALALSALDGDDDPRKRAIGRRKFETTQVVDFNKMLPEGV